MDDNAKKEKKIHKKILLWFDQIHEKKIQYLRTVKSCIQFL